MLTPKFEKYRDILPEVSARELALYEKHYALLREWNEKIALVSRKSIEFSFENHYADSVFIANFAKKRHKGEEVFDLGSGAGFPGFIFAIRYPEVRVTLFERIQKKKKFLELVQEELKLPKLRIEGDLCGRPRKGMFLARAVMPKEELFPFMEKQMAADSKLIVNSGGSSEDFVPRNVFHRLDQEIYTLPADGGSRKVECYLF